MSDTNIAKPLGQTVANTIPVAMVGLRNLAAIRLMEGGSVTSNTLALSAAQPTQVTLKPDAIDIGGNMTSAEEFEVQLVEPANGNCQRVLLAMTSPAIYRIAPGGDAGSTQPAQELRNVFQPVPASMSTQFVVRVVDDTGRSQYVATCPVASAAGFDNAGNPYVDIDATNTPILTSQQTGTVGGISGYASGRAWVNAVHVVHWEITTATQEAQTLKQYSNALGNLPTGGVDPNKYDLVRSYVDMATGQPIPQTTELVAEYAVDLDFAFSVDAGLTPAQPSIKTLAFGDPDNAAKYAPLDLTTALPLGQGPQRIRSVRARIATRTAMGDRAVNIPVTALSNTDTYMYRYCINTSPSCDTNDGTMRWARVRTMTTEVALPNQSRNFN
jgi:hypothetical protein